MTYKQYAEKNVKEMLRNEPNPQDMRDVALLALWLELCANKYDSPKNISDDYRCISEPYKAYSELSDIFPALKKYKEEHTQENLKKLCAELKEFCCEVYASTQNDAERQIFKSTIDKIKIL